MNNYTISMKINNNTFVMDNSADFGTMFEAFLDCVEKAKRFKDPIDEPVMTYKDAVLATDVSSIIRIGSALAGVDIMFTHSVTGYCITSIPLLELLESPETLRIPSDTININIVGKRQRMYDVFQHNMIVSNLNAFFTHWGEVVKDAQCVMVGGNLDDIKSTSSTEVDNDWMLGYYVRNELKQIKELLDTDLQEAKKRISVMEYMINSKVN